MKSTQWIQNVVEQLIVALNTESNEAVKDVLRQCSLDVNDALMLVRSTILHECESCSRDALVNTIVGMTIAMGDYTLLDSDSDLDDIFEWLADHWLARTSVLSSRLMFFELTCVFIDADKTEDAR